MLLLRCSGVDITSDFYQLEYRIGPSWGMTFFGILFDYNGDHNLQKTNNKKMIKNKNLEATDWDHNLVLLIVSWGHRSN